MKKPHQGPSIYYASDKNVYDALNQSRVDGDTIQSLFARRNIVCSKKTPREELSRFFSRLTHDSLDHAEISRRLGVVARRESVTSIDLLGIIKKDDLIRTVDKVKAELQRDGDVVRITEDGNGLMMSVQYSMIDYKRSEFSQVQHKDGDLEFIRVAEGYVVRSTQSEYVNKIRDAAIIQLQKEVAAPIEKISINLSLINSSSHRSQFFYDLMSELDGYVRRDVTDVYVYKPKPTKSKASLGYDDDQDVDPHIEKVLMRGNGVTQSKLLNDLIRVQKYYISRVEWISTEVLGKGYGFEIEAMFSDPADCSGFSYLLRGVYELDDDGKLSKRRRPPTKSEIDTVSRVIEKKAKEIVKKLEDMQAAATASKAVAA